MSAPTPRGGASRPPAALPFPLALALAAAAAGVGGAARDRSGTSDGGKEGWLVSDFRWR